MAQVVDEVTECYMPLDGGRRPLTSHYPYYRAAPRPGAGRSTAWDWARLVEAYPKPATQATHWELQCPIWLVSTMLATRIISRIR
jgi:hypothetical protein